MPKQEVKKSVAWFLREVQAMRDKDVHDRGGWPAAKEDGTAGWLAWLGWWVVRCPNVQMHKRSNAQMLKCTNAKMHKYSNARILKAQMLKRSNAWVACFCVHSFVQFCVVSILLCISALEQLSICPFDHLCI